VQGIYSSEWIILVKPRKIYLVACYFEPQKEQKNTKGLLIFLRKIYLFHMFFPCDLFVVQKRAIF